MKIYTFCISRSDVHENPFSDWHAIIALNEEGQLICECRAMNHEKGRKKIQQEVVSRMTDLDYQIEWLDGGLVEYIQRIKK